MHVLANADACTICLKRSKFALKASRYGTALHIACATHVPADFNSHGPGPLPTYCMSTTRLRPPVACTPRCRPGTTWPPSANIISTSLKLQSRLLITMRLRLGHAASLQPSRRLNSYLPPQCDVTHGAGWPWSFRLTPSQGIAGALAHATLRFDIKISTFFDALRASCWEGDGSRLHMASCWFACSPNSWHRLPCNTLQSALDPMQHTGLSTHAPPFG